MANKTKKTLEFRMSKKVAELTQVVHMLFTRNHEKEVEIDALKDAYEDEITLVVEDARTRIAEIDDKVVELERKLEREINQQSATIKETVAQETSEKEDEWRRKLVATEKTLNDEKVETNYLRDLLVNAQKDIEKLRQGLAEQVNFKSDEIQRRDTELLKLKRQVTDVERTMSTKDIKTSETIKNLERNNEKLDKEYMEMQELLEETYKVKENLTLKVKQLESELRALKKCLQKKITDVVPENHIVRVPRVTPIQHSFTDYNDELEKLRAEVKRYRLELQNRDANFNRVFTDQQRLIVGHKATGVSGMNSNQVLSRTISTSQISPFAVQGKERSFAYDILQGFEETHRPSSQLSYTSGSKLPTLSKDQRARLRKLIKPQPLPKEVLSSK